MKRRKFIDAGVKFIATSSGIFGLKGCTDINSKITTNSEPLSANEPDNFIQLSNLKIIQLNLTPYKTIENALSDAANIDWFKDEQKADAITLAYAVKELKSHLQKINIKSEIVHGKLLKKHSKNIIAQSYINLIINGTSFIDDEFVEYNLKNLEKEGYAIIFSKNNINICSNNRVGVLNGVYRYLQELGFAWHDSIETILPNQLKLVTSNKWTNIIETPNIKYRGFWIYEKISDEYAIWLRRNRLNIGGLVGEPLKSILGFNNWAGGHDHIQEEFSKPSLFELNPTWFGFVEGSYRRISASGDYVNPCFANPEASNYFANKILQRLTNGDLKNVDILNLWPNDSRFNSFDQSELAKKIGNEVDNLLFFYLIVIKKLQTAYLQGKINRFVQIFGISYYITLMAPTNKEIIKELEAYNFTNIFYPIGRSWDGVFLSQLENKNSNRKYFNSINAWKAGANFNYGVVHYHNMSAYAGIALTDNRMFVHNLLATNYKSDALYAYMHPLLSNPGPRRLTNQLIANLSWNIVNARGTKSLLYESYERVVSTYFQNRYGEWANKWQKIYDLVELSVDNAREMFGDNGLFWILFQKYIWPGPLIYKKNEITAMLNKFLVGGVQDLALKFSPNQISDDTSRESFRGLIESVQMQNKTKILWANLLTEVTNSAVKARMLEDIQWFESTLTRYRLMINTCYYYMAVVENRESVITKKELQDDVDVLKNSPITKDTLSPVDQRAFLKMHQMMIDDVILF